MIVFALFLSFSLYSTQTLAYKAVVVEYAPYIQDTAEKTVLKNLEVYQEHVESARNQSADIIIFPEYGLTSIVQDPEAYSTKLNDSEHIITKLKNMAKTNQIYVVVNLIEKEEVSGKSTKYYNTNLVFNKNGEIFQKYRKINLRNEPRLTAGSRNQSLTFTTDFHITFGIFTGSDIFYEVPSRSLLESNLVTDVIYPTALVAAVPFYHSLSLQYGYAVSNGVNVLAAGYDQPAQGKGGSGIYLGDGTIVEKYIYDISGSKRLAQDVTGNYRQSKNQCSDKFNPYGLPGELNRSQVANYKNERIFNHNKYTFQPINLHGNNDFNSKICHNKFCCEFQIKIATSSASDKFKLVAFDGFDKLDEIDQRLRFCSLVACKDDSNESCGDRITTNTTFMNIIVKTNIQDKELFYIPVTLDSELYPIKTQFCSNQSSDSFNLQVSATKTKDLLAFGILGKTSSANHFTALGVFIVTAVSFLLHNVCVN